MRFDARFAKDTDNETPTTIHEKNRHELPRTETWPFNALVTGMHAGRTGNCDFEIYSGSRLLSSQPVGGIRPAVVIFRQHVSGHFDLYNHAYRGHDSDVYRQIRMATYGSDFGQTSWVTTEESDAIPRLLEISKGSEVLEIGFGSGCYALHLAEICGCHVTGLDINSEGVATAGKLARQAGLQAMVSFRQHDVSERLAFEGDSFEAAFCNDSFCHIPDRLSLLRELCRVLRPGGRLVFSDALVIAGLITNEELAARSSIGRYVFAASGVNEMLVEQAGLHLDATTDTTSGAAAIAQRWRDARQAHAAQLLDIEGKDNYEGLQQFLNCTFTLLSQGRLRRFLYQASKQIAL